MKRVTKSCEGCKVKMENVPENRRFCLDCGKRCQRKVQKYSYKGRAKWEAAKRIMTGYNQ